ncbi:UbiX family flavin prenyltransferase [Candidatus Sumerlaeota bacterium]|nr:UbiX family flavin prenyltransferase [Candidatus Sumerlaeota bacterium]
MSGKRILVGIAGASGAIYAQRLLEFLATSTEVEEILVTISDAGRRVLAEELGVASEQQDLSDFASWLDLSPEAASRLRLLDVHDVGAGPASGTFPLDAVAIVPCSMRTLAAVAHGLADNLIARAADVAIKEGRRLVFCPRETPLSAIHLENMTRLARLGARIVAPSPAFYHHPKSVEDLVRFVVQKIVEQMGIGFPGGVRWQ